MDSFVTFVTALPPALLVLIGTLGGGLGVEWIRRRGAARIAATTGERAERGDIRTELWEEITKLRERMGVLETELDLWRGKYFELHEQKSLLVAQKAMLEGANALLEEKLSHCLAAHSLR